MLTEVVIKKDKLKMKNKSKNYENCQTELKFSDEGTNSSHTAHI